MRAINLFSIFGTVGLKDEASRGLDSIEQKSDKVAGSMSKMGGNFKDVGDKMGKVGGKMTKAISLPIIGIGAASLKLGADFDASMSNVQAISGATGDDMIKLEKLARDMGATTKFSASEASEGLGYMAMAGWDTQQMMSGLPGILSLAAASGEDLGTTSDIVTDALTGFGLGAKDATKFADLLASASSNSNTNVAMMGETFKYAAPVFGALGYSAEDAALATGLMANAGIKASQAGTTLRSAVTNLVNPNKKAADAMERLGITMTDSDGEMKPFGETIGDLRTSFKSLTKEQQAQEAAAMFGKEAMSGMLAIINASDEDYDKLTKATTEYSGAAEEMSDIMNDNLGGSLEIMKSALSEAGLQLSEIMTPHVRKFVEFLTKMIDKFNGLSDNTKKIIIVVGGIIAILGPILVVFGALASSIGSIITLGTTLSGVFGAAGAAAAGGAGGAGLLGTAMAVITGPIGAVIAIVLAVIAALVLLYKNSETFRDGVAKVFEAAKVAIGAALEFIKVLFKNVWDVLLALFDVFKALFSGDVEGFTEAIKKLFDVALKAWYNISKAGFDLIISIVKLAWEVIVTIFNTAKEIVTNILKVIVGVVKNQFEKIKDFMTNPIENAKNAIKKIVDTIKGFFTNLKIKLPKITMPSLPKLPKLSIGGNFSLAPPSVPKIKWNAEGGIFDSPTIFNTNKGMQGVGEAGSEVIAPLTKLKDWVLGLANAKDDNLTRALLSSNRTLVTGISKLQPTKSAATEYNIVMNITGDWTVDSDERQESVVEEFTNEVIKKFRSRGEK